MANFTNPIQVGFGQWLSRCRQQLVADTPALAEFVARDFAKAAVWAPGRMIDQVESMLDSWRKNDTAGAARATPFQPVLIAAIAKDYTPAPPEFSRQLANPLYVRIPGDAKERVFRMRVVVAEIRAQVAILAYEPNTARSIAMQMHLFAEAAGNQRFYADYPLIGMSSKWPVVFETPDLMAAAVANEQKNLTALTVDFSLRASVPLLQHPNDGAADADGLGTGTANDPDGYLTVSEVTITRRPGVTAAPGQVETVGGD